MNHIGLQHKESKPRRLRISTSSQFQFKLQNSSRIGKWTIETNDASTVLENEEPWLELTYCKKNGSVKVSPHAMDDFANMIDLTLSDAED